MYSWSHATRIIGTVCILIIARPEIVYAILNGRVLSCVVYHVHFYVLCMYLLFRVRLTIKLVTRTSVIILHIYVSVFVSPMRIYTVYSVTGIYAEYTRLSLTLLFLLFTSPCVNQEEIRIRGQKVELFLNLPRYGNTN